MNDCWSLITILLDNETLQKCHCSGLDFNLSVSSLSQAWWFRRVEVLTATSLSMRTNYCWKQAYSILSRCLSNPTLGMKNITCEDDNPIVVEVFLAMGLQAPKYILDHCVAIYLPNVLAYILDNEKMEIRPGSGVLMMAVVENKLDMLEVLLSHPRLTDFNNMVFRSLAVHCIQFHSYEALQLLVNDKRCNPSQPDNDLLIRALHRASSISANILVNSPNFELGSIEEIAPALLDNRSIEDATQLLQDIPKLAEIWLNRWRACKANSLSVLVA